MISVKVGDWLRIPMLWPGIWRASRVLTGFKEDRWSLDDPLKSSRSSLVFCHRLVNDAWERSFSHQSCEISLIRTLEPSERKRIDRLLSSDHKLAAAFEKYQATTKPINLIANLGFGGLSKKEAREFPHACARLLTAHINTGLTMDDVLNLIRNSGLDSHKHKLPQQRTLQLISVNHELRGDRFVYRQFRKLDF